MEHNRFDSISNSWPMMLAKSIGDMLLPLLTQGAQISLERLQLVSITVRLDTGVASVEPVVTRVDEDFLTITKAIAISADRFAICTIRYFVRGRRQFFRHENTLRSCDQVSSPEVISAKDIRDFLAIIHQLNSAHYDQTIAQLSGRRTVMVPSLLLMVLCLEKACTILAQGQDWVPFELLFLRAVWQDDDVVLRFHENTSCHLHLEANGHLAAILTATLS